MTAIIRAATVEDAPGIASVQAESWRTTYAGMVPDDVIAQYGGYDRRVAQWTRMLTGAERTQAIFVVNDHGRIIGFALGGPLRSSDLPYQGELYALQTSPYDS